MSKPSFIIADTDTTYLTPLETKFLTEYGDKINLYVITDKEYFGVFFSQPRNADVLVVSEDLYVSELHKHDIDSVFVLTEKEQQEETERLDAVKIFKYTSLKEIFGKIVSISRNALRTEIPDNRTTKTVMFYSASGGVGKTTLALSLSHCMANNYKKILYVNAERLNTFQHHLKDATPISGTFSNGITEDAQIYGTLGRYIRNEGFDYLPPFERELSSLNVDYSIYEQMISAIKAKNEYDYIIVDTDSSFDLEKASLITAADKVFIVFNQTRSSFYATSQLRKNINCIDSEKYYFVCNKFDTAGHAAVGTSGAVAASSFTIGEKVKRKDDVEEIGTAEFANDEDIKRLMYLLV